MMMKSIEKRWIQPSVIYEFKRWKKAKHGQV